MNSNIIIPSPELINVWLEWFPNTRITAFEVTITDRGHIRQINYKSKKDEDYFIRFMDNFVMCAHVLGQSLEPHWISIGSINAIYETIKNT